ncbi:c-type cytochrome [Maritalea porphyrae]|jgi:cytochrome c556|uniref:c-type cytochrome n=1 Tax=Maritalea porphyrae TaxID=880732 RepID=UPI0022B011E8|nr:cytochrome c [Maritalea porphyrae]MCZ4271017.1 cytochrome c [Maritalea porphyrae]
MKFKIVLAAVAGLSLAFAGSAIVADEDPIAARQSAMKSMGAALKAGDVAAVAPLAAQLKLLFPEGSTSEKSEASPKIWEEWDDFIAILDKLEADATAGAAVPVIGGSCKACHDNYRVKKG